MFETLVLPALRLPEGDALQRDSILAPEAQPDGFEERYDFSTLAYGAVHQPERRRIVLVCPRLLNLEAAVRAAEWRSDAGRHPVRRIRSYRRWDAVELAADSGAGPLLHSPWGDLDVTAADRRFAGGHVLMTLSKDNDLIWIAEWARHMVDHQGTTHVLFFDNGSTAYAPEEVTGCLAGVPGLQGALTVSVPLPYGPQGKKPPRGLALFLQSGLLNLARLRFAPAARTVTCCDIDELLVSAPGTRLIDAAQASPLGYATALCHWRYAPDGDSLPRFGDHILRRDPNGVSKEKWCIVPTGRLGRAAWDIHGAAGYWFNRLALQRHHRFYHCADITTGWKRGRGSGSEHTLVEDDATRADLERLGLR